LANATETIQALQNRLPSVPDTAALPFADPDEEPAVLPALAGLSTSTRDALIYFSPFGSDYMDARQLSPGVAVVIVKSKSTEGAFDDLDAWYADTNTGTFRWLQTSSAMCEELSLREWDGGIVVDYYSSPCEAVQKIQSSYFDRKGIKVAATEQGNFDRDGTTMDASIGSVKLKAEIIQGSKCVTPEGIDWHTPTTTIIGVKVNGHLAKLSAPIGVECAAVYGEAFSDYQFPVPSFDGQRITFRLPGYDAAISSDGRVTFTARVAYLTEFNRDRLIREDQTGFHEVRSHFASDPIFDGYLRTSKEDPEYHFEVASYDGRIVTIKILRFHYPTQQDVDTGMTVEYDTKTDTFQNLVSK
jgi:hypothetical protein